MSRAPKGTGRLLVLLSGLASSLLGAAPPKYVIQGIAVSSRDGAPVPFCRLSVEAAAGSAPARPFGNPRLGSGGRSAQRPGSPGPRTSPNPPRESKNEAVADGSGHFTLQVPSAGSWRLLGVARGFHSQIFEEHEGFYTAIVLTPDAPIFHTTFRMSPDAIITGVILDEAGEGVRSAQVAAERVALELPGESRAATGGPLRQVEVATTDDRGQYELAGLSPGSYVVRVQGQPWYASAPGIQRLAGTAATGSQTADPSLDVVYATTWFPAADNEAQAQPLVLTGGEERQADFHLNPSPAVHLQIPRQDTPAPEVARPKQQLRPVTINRISTDGSGTFSSVTFSNESGSGWEFGGLTPGTYEIHLPGPDGRPDGETRQIEVRSGASGVVTLEGSTSLTRVTVQVDGVADGDVAAVEFVDTETGRRIPAMPPPGRRGRRRADGDDDDGNEEPGMGRLALLAPHTYDVIVTSRFDGYLSSLDANGAKVSGTRVTVADGSPVLHLHVARGRGSLSGFALLPDHPAEGALVLLVPISLGAPGNTLPVLRDQANSDGSFLLSAVTPGKYILLAIDHGWDVNWRDPRSLERYLLKGVAVDLRPTGRLSETIQAQIP